MFLRVSLGGAKWPVVSILGGTAVVAGASLGACVGGEPPIEDQMGIDASSGGAESGPGADSDAEGGPNEGATDASGDAGTLSGDAEAAAADADASPTPRVPPDAEVATCTGAPCAVAGLLAWYRSDVGVIQTAQGLVTAWIDQSGNRNDALEAVPSAPGADQGPSLQQAGFDGLPLPALYFNKPAFNRSPNILSTAPFAAPLVQPFTEFGVALPTSQGSGDRWSLSDGLSELKSAQIGYDYATRTSNGTVMPSLYIFAGNEVDSFDVPIGLLPAVLEPVAVWTGVFKGALSQIFMNGSLRASGNAGANRLDGLSVGNFPGYLGEFLLFQGALSADDRATIEAYLRGRWLVADAGADANADGGTGADAAADH